MDGWLGVVAPAGTSRSIGERLSAEVSKTVKDPVFVREKLIQQDYELLGSSPEEMGATMQAHFQKYAKIIQDAKIPSE